MVYNPYGDRFSHKQKPSLMGGGLVEENVHATKDEILMQSFRLEFTKNAEAEEGKDEESDTSNSLGEFTCETEVKINLAVTGEDKENTPL